MQFKQFSPFAIAAVLLSGSLFFSSCKKDDEDPMDEETIDSPVFLSSNTSGMVTVTDESDDPVSTFSFNASGMDADGIYYMSSSDMLFQLDRTHNKIVSYSGVLEALQDGGTPTKVAESTSDFVNGREITVDNGMLIVAQDASADNGNVNQFVVYDISKSSQISYVKTIMVDINLWGMDMMGSSMIAIVDNSDSVAVFNNFLNNADGSTAQADVYVSIENLVRTHGIHYVSGSDMMLLTDVGDAASATDGGIVIINGWTSKMNMGVIPEGEQIRIYGPNSKLGNPVDIAYNPTGNMIYIAERKNEIFLSFMMPSASGDMDPASLRDVAGASAIYFE